MRLFLLSMLALLLAGTAGAQDSADPSTWEITATASGNGLYALNFHVRLKPGWHIWSLHPGVDSSLIPPAFDIDEATATPVGPASEQGFSTDMQLPGVEGYARFYNNEALFIRQVKAAPAKTVKGSYTYQLCNDQMCLPPKTVPFSVKMP